VSRVAALLVIVDSFERATVERPQDRASDARSLAATPGSERFARRLRRGAMIGVSTRRSMATRDCTDQFTPGSIAAAIQSLLAGHEKEPETVQQLHDEGFVEGGGVAVLCDDDGTAHIELGDFRLGTVDATTLVPRHRR
jgi:hypothetical protein